MGMLFEDEAFADFMFLMKNNRKSVEKINSLLQDIKRNGVANGIGHPEPLRHRPAWSRHIDHGNRLVYDTDENGNIRIISCKGHYDD